MEWYGKGGRNRIDHPGKEGRKGERRRLGLEVDVRQRSTTLSVLAEVIAFPLSTLQMHLTQRE